MKRSDAALAFAAVILLAVQTGAGGPAPGSERPLAEGAGRPLAGGEEAGRAATRAEPEFCGTGAHDRSAVYDFSNTYMFSRWAVVMETGRAVLMKDITFSGDAWAGRAPIPSGGERAWHVAVYDPADRIVIVGGGYCWKSGMQNPVYRQDLRVYDPALDAWTGKGASKLPQSSAGVWDPREGCLLACGGKEVVGGATVVSDETWAWFPSNESWVRRADLPAPRFGQCAAWDPENGLMLVFGGTNGTAYYSDVWAYDYTADSWTVLSPVADEIPLPRAFSSAAWDPNKREMLVHGGENADIDFLSTWSFSFANNTWLHRSSAPWTRSMHAACWDSDRGVLVVCGAGAMGNNDTWTYEPGSDSWGQNAPLPGAFRSGSAGVYDPVGKRFLVIGGADPLGNCQGETWAFKPGSMEWNYFSPGYMQPSILDLGPDTHSIDRVSWEEELPPGTSITLKLRTSDDNTSFRPFVVIENGGRPGQQGRYVIWNMTFTASPDRLSSPVLGGVVVEYTVNRRPSCSAGGDRAAFKRQAVVLGGTGSDPDGDPLSFEWTISSALAGRLENASLADAAFTPLASGLHELRLVVNDSFARSAASLARVAVANRPPVAMAGPDLRAFKNDQTTLSGEASDPDLDELHFNWTQLGGPKVVLSRADTASAAFSPAKAANYTFELKVDDGENESFDRVNVTVLGRPPVARLEASPLETDLRGRVNFSAAGSTDPDGFVLKYLFDFGDGERTDWVDMAEVVHLYGSPGTFSATVSVRDDDGNVSGPSTAVGVTVRNAVPVVSASVLPREGNISTVFGFQADPSSFDPDGNIVSHEWSFGDGGTGLGSRASHSYKRPGSYAVLLKVTDDRGAVAEARLNVTVGNEPPSIIKASPGRTPTFTIGSTASFSVEARDLEGGALTHVWRVDGRVRGGNSSRFSFEVSARTRNVSVEVSDGESSVTVEWRLKVVEGGERLDALLPVGILAATVVGVGLSVLALRASRRGKRG